VGKGGAFDYSIGEKGLRLFVAVNSNEMGYGAIVGALGLWREETAWQLSHTPVIADAFAALALSGTGLIGAGALCCVSLNVAFHNTSSLYGLKRV
jgi:hypothetical protein